eukprot:s3819_g7.t1
MATEKKIDDILCKMENTSAKDPFKDRRAGLAPGEVPVMTYTQPGMGITTIEVPAHADKQFYDAMLRLLAAALSHVVQLVKAG